VEIFCNHGQTTTTGVVVGGGPHVDDRVMKVICTGSEF